MRLKAAFLLVLSMRAGITGAESNNCNALHQLATSINKDYKAKGKSTSEAKDFLKNYPKELLVSMNLVVDMVYFPTASSSEEFKRDIDSMCIETRFESNLNKVIKRQDEEQRASKEKEEKKRLEEYGEVGSKQWHCVTLQKIAERSVESRNSGTDIHAFMEAYLLSDSARGNSFSTATEAVAISGYTTPRGTTPQSWGFEILKKCYDGRFGVFGR